MSTANLTERTRVLRLRQVLGLTQREFADEFGVAPAAVAQWESGKRRLPGPALKLLDFYEVEVGLDRNDGAAHEDGAWVPVGGFARRKAALESVALAIAWRYLASDADPSSIAGRIRTKSFERYVETASRLKGLSMKLLQMLSFMSMVVDESEREMLAQIRRRAAPMPQMSLDAVFQKAFRNEPNRLFATWSPRPFDITSLGQVHDATLFDGRRVVVKVQYPLMVKAFKTDLESIDHLDRLYSLVARSQTPGVFFAEIRDRFLEECDYALEAASQNAYADVFRDRQDIAIPSVIAERSAATILTTERSDGMSFDAFVQRGSRAAKNRASHAIWSYLAEPVHARSMLNADVHPGNFLFDADGRVTCIDFGRVKRFSPAFAETYRGLTRAILERDRDACSRMLDAFGVTRRGFDYDAGFRIFAFMYSPALGEGPFTFSPDFIRDSWRAWTTANPNRLRFSFGHDHVFWHQMFFGGSALHARLGSTFDSRSLLLDLVYAPGEPRPRPWTQDELAELGRFVAGRR